MMRILVLSLGGTIAMGRNGQTGVVPTLSGEMLVAAVPELSQVADVQARSFRQMPGAHLTFADLEALAAEIETAARHGVAGVVVTQGTDTIEETAFALDLLLNIDMPVVVTGAMRNPTVPGADGPANLLGAVQVAASGSTHGLGCVVVMSDEIHAARYVRKVHTSSVAAFASSQAGPIGWISEGRVRIASRPARVPAIERSGGVVDAPVGLVTLALQDDGVMVRAARSCGLHGLVVEGMGGGHASLAGANELEAAAGVMPVVLASRTGAGEVLAQTYGFPGGEIDLQNRGLIRAGWLDGLKARVLLSLLLRQGVNRDSIRRYFEDWGGG